MLHGRFVMQSDVLSRTNDDGTIILMKKYNNKLFFKLDGIAAEVWKNLSNGMDLKVIEDSILSEYSITEEALRKDISLLLNTLMKKDLIRHAGEVVSDPVEFSRQWPKSLHLLKERILEYFKTEGLPVHNIWFTDIEMAFPDRLLKEEHVQVVFFGAFFERVFESGNWPDKKYSFWCLSSRVHNMLLNMFQFPEHTIGLIPRDKLLNSKASKALDLNKDLKIVYAGRISAQKNIEHLLAFSSALQKELSVKVETLILGEWDNNVPKGRGRFTLNSFSKNIEIFMKSCEFKTQPQFIHDLDDQEWLKHLDGNTLFANFSTFICEDFGYALLQAQENGIPMILSDWGGHADVSGEKICLIPREEIGESLGPVEEILEKGTLSAKTFLKIGLSEKNANLISRKPTVHLSLSDLNKVRLSMMTRFGFELAMLGQDRANLIANAGRGKLFFESYDAFFSGKMT